MTLMTALVWLRRDLRLKDNKILNLATHAHKKVFVCFIFDSMILKKLPSDDKRVSFLFETIHRLKEQLQEDGADLHLEYGDPKELIPSLASKLKVEEVYVTKDFESYAKKEMPVSRPS